MKPDTSLSTELACSYLKRIGSDRNVSWVIESDADDEETAMRMLSIRFQFDDQEEGTADLLRIRDRFANRLVTRIATDGGDYKCIALEARVCDDASVLVACACYPTKPTAGGYFVWAGLVAAFGAVLATCGGLVYLLRLI